MSINEMEKLNLKRKKGEKNVFYKCEIIKKARVKNEEYTNWKGNVVVSKPYGMDCRCSKKCLPQLIDKEEQECTYKKFVSFNSKDEQDSHLEALIQVKSVDRKRPRVKEGDTAKKNKPQDLSYVYWLNTMSIGKVQVCKAAFLNVYGITDNRIRRIRKLQAEGNPPIDKRGKCTPGNAKPSTLILNIQNHIRSFPVHETQYSSKTYHFLNPRLNILTTWKLYKTLYPDSNVKYSFYSKIFKQHFDLRFGQPHIDTCWTCETLSLKLKSHTLNDVAKRVAAAELLVHKQRAKKFYKKIEFVSKLVETSNDSAGLCFDYMQNVQLPQTPIQETFYLRQLSVSLFNIHCLKTNKVRYFLYHEGIGKKSPNEVCTCLLEYISEVVGPNVKHLYLFSDGCGGQNKNHTLVRVLLMLVAQGRFKTITHYFPIRDHSYL